jgi:hypothetical protein
MCADRDALQCALDLQRQDEIQQTCDLLSYLDHNLLHQLRACHGLETRHCAPLLGSFGVALPLQKLKEPGVRVRLEMASKT